MCDKNAVREKLKIKRRYLNGVRREAFDLYIKENFLAAFGGYSSFFIYNSFSSEADTSGIISGLLSENKRVYLPRVDGGFLVAVAYSDKQEKGAYGIFEPQGEAFCGETEVTVIPLLAVNEKGYRIGYGKGYYDKYLKDRHTLKVGLGYSFQIEKFTADAWDIPLDFFVCEKGIYTYADDTKGQ